MGESYNVYRIPDRVSIHDRPRIIAKVNNLAIGKETVLLVKIIPQDYILNMSESPSLIRFERLVRITAEEAVIAAQNICVSTTYHARRSTTLDNGSEHTNHKELKVTLGIQAYFADPYASWQRGGNENGNLWIRYYFPKGTDFSTISDEELRDVEWELNNRPRKRLKFKTPQEVFSEYLNKP